MTGWIVKMRMTTTAMRKMLLLAKEVSTHKLKSIDLIVHYFSLPCSFLYEVFKMKIFEYF